MADRVILHVGLPKTGTSFVQDRLFHNPEALAEQGYAYPADRPDAQFLAALDLMQLTWGGLEAQAVGAWDRLAAEVRAAEGTVILSHEILGYASRAHVARALESLGTGTEVDLVVSARDLVRQVPAEWQENVKHRRTLGFGEFVDLIREPDRSSTVASWFWGVQDLPGVLERWGDPLPADRVHVVTVPRPGADRDLLWHRFAEVLGLDPDSTPAGTNRDNPSLGVPETALVRRLNERLRDVLPNERYRQFVREHLVHQTLSRGQTSARLSVPPDVHAWAAGVSAEWVERLRARGYAVVGDLDDLLPGPALPWADPDDADPAEVADAGLKGLTAMVLEAARLRDVEIELHEVIADRDRELARMRNATAYRVKRRLVRAADENAVARVGYGAYRSLVGRRRRSRWM